LFCVFFFLKNKHTETNTHTVSHTRGGGSFINQIKLENENKTNISSEYRDWSRLPFFVLIKNNKTSNKQSPVNLKTFLHLEEKKKIIS